MLIYFHDLSQSLNISWGHFGFIDFDYFEISFIQSSS